MNYSQAVHYLYALGNEIQTAKLGLDRITRLLAALGNPHHACRFIHVAGTNGKGSTSAMIASGLRSAGIRTGLYTSPHLVEPTERIQLAGEPVTPDQFADAFQQVHTTALRMLDAAEIDLHPTYFETVTAMAFVLFEQHGMDRVVLEVGLGGRLDATNVVAPELCVVTPIDLDHQTFLGDTLPAIAREKAGILKPSVPAVFAQQHPEAEMVLRAAAQGPFTFTRDWPVADLQIDKLGSSFCFNHHRVRCPLAGEHQVENARTAALTLHQLGFPPDGIANTRWPGRLEHVSQSPEIILDGAHNPAGALALANYIRRFYSGRRIWIVFGVMRDKMVPEITSLLFPLADRVILTMPENSRALTPEKISAPHAAITHHLPEALQLIRRVPPEDVVFVTGSLFVVGEARALLVQ